MGTKFGNPPHTFRVAVRVQKLGAHEEDITVSGVHSSESAKNLTWGIAEATIFFQNARGR